jgi:uncharacterized membrane protein
MTNDSRERGAVIPFLALCISVIVLVGAFSVDLGRAMVLRRDLQRVADITALDASKFLTSGTATSQLTSVRNAAVRSAARNNWTLDPSDVHLVQLSGDTWTRIDTSTSVPDGVEVVAHGSVSYDFQPGGTSTTRSAVASRQSAAGVEIGTDLATIDTSEATMLNRVFGVFGGNSGMALDLVSWRGLATGDVTLGDLAVAAGSSDTDAFLTATTTYGEQLQIVARALTAEGDTATATAVDAYRDALSATVTGLTVRAGDFLSVSTGDADSVAGASLDVLSLLRGELFLARQGIAVSGTFGSNVLGIGNVTLNAQVVHPPTIAFGPVGTSATNGQISFNVSTSLLGVPVQLGASAATGSATLTSVACTAIGPSASATASARTTLTGLTLSLANLPISLGLTAAPPTTLSFASPFTWINSQHVGATTLGLATTLGGALGPLGPILGTAVNGLLAPLENAVVSPILRGLGVSVAGADVAVLDPVCLPPVLSR